MELNVALHQQLTTVVRKWQKKRKKNVHKVEKIEGWDEAFFEDLRLVE